MRKQMTSKFGIRLLTAGTQIAENIEVVPVLQEKTATENGVVSPDTGYAGLSEVTVNVQTPAPTLQEKTAVPRETALTITPDSGYDGLSQVTVAAIHTVTVTYQANGTYQPQSGEYIKKVTVAIPEYDGTVE